MRLGLAHVVEARVHRVIVAGDADRVDPRGHQGLLVRPIVAQSSPIVSADKSRTHFARNLTPYTVHPNLGVHNPKDVGRAPRTIHYA